MDRVLGKQDSYSASRLQETTTHLLWVRKREDAVMFHFAKAYHPESDRLFHDSSKIHRFGGTGLSKLSQDHNFTEFFQQVLFSLCPKNIQLKILLNIFLSKLDEQIK